MVTWHLNRWSPDTCGCKFEYQWDEELAVRDRVSVWKENLRTCPDHMGLTDANLYDVVLGENQRKNITIVRIETEVPDLKETYTDPETGEPNRIRYKWQHGIDWSFSGSDDTRLLTMVIRGSVVSSSERTRINNLLRTEFGTNKVTIT